MRALVYTIGLALAVSMLGPGSASAAEPEPFVPDGSVHLVPSSVPLSATTTGGNAIIAGFYYLFSANRGGPVWAGPVGSRVLSYRNPSDFLPTTRSLGLRLDCPEEPYPVRSVYQEEGGGYLDLSECYESEFNPQTSSGGGLWGYIAPTTAHTLDGDPLTFHGWQIEGGYHGAEFCDTGELGIVHNPGSPGEATWPGVGDLTYGAGVAVQSYVRVSDRTDSNSKFYDVPPKPVHYKAVYAPPSPDISGPVLRLGTPIDCQTFQAGEVVNADYDCDDVLGAGMETCTGTVADGAPLDTSAGSHTFTVTGTDKAGNTRTRTVTYEVVGDPPPPDEDGDGVPDADDLCPSDSDPGQEDADNDGLGDACDPDANGDGFDDALGCTVTGTPGNDTLRGGANAVVCGGDGNDTIRAKSGAKITVHGGDGHDKIFASSGSDTLNGGAGNDRFEGSSGNDIIDGGDGDDRLQGNAGNDTLDGGPDTDTLHGGRGTDQCTAGETIYSC